MPAALHDRLNGCVHHDASEHCFMSSPDQRQIACYTKLWEGSTWWASCVARNLQRERSGRRQLDCLLFQLDPDHAGNGRSSLHRSNARTTTTIVPVPALGEKERLRARKQYQARSRHERYRSTTVKVEGASRRANMVRAGHCLICITTSP